MTLSSLPVLKVEIAFSCTDLYATTQTWTEVTPYVRDFQTRGGRQHYLDRVEASTITMTLNNRTGFFSSGSTVLGVRMPIKVTATYSSVPYTVFYGVVDYVAENVEDILNLDLTVTASDFTKYMSLRYMNTPQLWAGHCTPPSMGGTATSAIHWYDCNASQRATVVSASATSTLVTYYYAPGTSTVFSYGDTVTVTGLTQITGAAYNQTNVPVVAAGLTYFQTPNRVGGTPVGNSTGQGIATYTVMKDLISGLDAELIGYGSFTNNGSVIYEVNTAVDTASGGTENLNCNISIPKNNTAITSLGGVDFWILGASLAISNIIMILRGASTWYHELYVDDQGRIGMSSGLNSHTATSVAGPVVNDGYWHHVGIVSNDLGQIGLFCDGQYYYPPVRGTGPLYTDTFFSIADQVPCYIDEIVISNYSSLSTLPGEVMRRYKAGSLLQIGYPTTTEKIRSGDRIAEILCVAGFGNITGGNSTTQATITLTRPFYINGVAWTYDASTNGYTYAEPYFWDSPVTSSTSLDLILQVCDTDIGFFCQLDDGSFSYYDQARYGTWTYDAATKTGSWLLNSFGTTVDANHTWTDTGASGTIPYIGPTLQILRDDADLWTTVKVTPQSGTQQIFENKAKETQYGYTTLTKSGTLHTTLNDALSTATYLGYLFQNPIPRVVNVQLTSETVVGGVVGAIIPAMLGANFGDVVNFQRNPNGASTAGQINRNYVIESVQYEFQANPGYWHASFVLDPYPLAPNTTSFP